MSVDNHEMVQMQNNIRAMIRDVPEIMKKLIKQEGEYAVKQAKIICKTDNPDVINTGLYRNSFHCGDSASDTVGVVKASGNTYSIEVYNNLDYARPLEYGFRSHFVPGYWQGNTFVYVKGYQPPKGKPGGMYVGPKNGYVKGRYVLRRAVKRTTTTQDARLRRKINKILHERGI